MDTVKSVQEEPLPVLTRAASKSKTWSNLKVYFQKNEILYLQYYRDI